MFRKKLYLILIIIGIIIVVIASSKLYVSESFINKEKSIQDVFDSIKNTDIILSGFCKQEQHNYESLEEEDRRILVHYIQHALSKINRVSQTYIPYNFSFIEIIRASSATDSFGNVRWKVDIMVEERTYHTSLRIEVDFIIFIEKQNQSNTYNTLPLPVYIIGYPSTNQIIPLPEEVMSSGVTGVMLSHKYKHPDYPSIKELVIHNITIQQSDNVLGYDKITNCPNKSKGYVEGISKIGSPYKNKPLTRNDISFYEKNYADCIEKNNKGIDSDIYLDDTWKPSKQYDTTYHSDSNTETFNQSNISSYPDGWIQPSIWRNKWHRLWAEPRDRLEFPSNEKPKEWDTMGIRKNESKKGVSESNYLGSRWSTMQTPRIPLYWPTITGLPRNESSFEGIFGSVGNVIPNLPH